jgi:thiamine biosynthesis lipoprotein
VPPPRRQFALRDAAPRWWLVLAVLLGLSAYAYLSRPGCQGTRSTPIEGRTMGTSYRVALGRPLGAGERGQLEQLIAGRLAAIERSMSTYDPRSEVSRFNRHASTEPFEVSGELAALVSLAQKISVASEGAFDVTVGPLVQAWGFGPAGRPVQPVSDDQLRLLLERVGHDKLRVEGTRLRKQHPGLEIDLSAIAKGYAVDELIELLLVRGHGDALVDIGGETRAHGVTSTGRPFRVAIADPRRPDRGAYGAVSLVGALATSGNYRYWFDLAGQRVVHTIDPATGRPDSHGLLSASVLDPRCAVADAWATALMAAGPERARALAARHALSVLLLTASAGDRLDMVVTAGFREAFTTRTGI